MKGNLDMDDNTIIGIKSSSQDDAALAVGGTKSIYLPFSGNRQMSGNLHIGGNATENNTPFVEDDSSQAASDAQRNDVVKLGYFHTQRGKLKKKLLMMSFMRL